MQPPKKLTRARARAPVVEQGSCACARERMKVGHALGHGSVTGTGIARVATGGECSVMGARGEGPAGGQGAGQGGQGRGEGGWAAKGVPARADRTAHATAGIAAGVQLLRIRSMGALRQLGPLSAISRRSELRRLQCDSTERAEIR